MAYLTATRYGLTHIEPTEQQRASGWRQVWEHPSGMLAMRHPSTGRWMVAWRGDDGLLRIDGGRWSSSLRAAALSIEHRLNQSSERGSNAALSLGALAASERTCKQGDDTRKEPD
jgi:hypothetical protein